MNNQQALPIDKQIEVLTSLYNAAKCGKSASVLNFTKFATINGIDNGLQNRVLGLARPMCCVEDVTLTIEGLILDSVGCPA